MFSLMCAPPVRHRTSAKGGIPFRKVSCRRQRNLALPFSPFLVSVVLSPGMTSSSAGYRQGGTDAAYYASSPTSTPATSTRGARYSDASDMITGSANANYAEGVAATPMGGGSSPHGMSGAAPMMGGTATHGVSTGHVSTGHTSAAGMSGHHHGHVTTGHTSAVMSGHNHHHGGPVLRHDNSEEVCGRKTFTQVSFFPRITLQGDLECHLAAVALSSLELPTRIVCRCVCAGCTDCAGMPEVVSSTFGLHALNSGTACSSEVGQIIPCWH